MDRRKFLTYSGLSLLSSYALSFMPTGGKFTRLNQLCTKEIEYSIKANFGSGFKLLEQTQQGEFINAKITHLGNTYLVTNSPSGQWNILESSIS